MQEPYDSFAGEIKKNGFFVTDIESMGNWSRVTVASQRRAGGGYTGNGFWLSYLSDKWYLGTWGGTIYRLADECNAAQICVEWLTRETNATKADFDQELKTKYGLIEMSDDDFHALAGEN